jgi:hypothetical protein
MRSVSVCGSGRFKSLIHDVCAELDARGIVTLKPPLHEMTFADALTEEQRLLAWKGATFAHLQRVAIADICLLINPGGYLGAGTTLELGYAVALRKLIISLQPDTEPARQAVINIVIGTDEINEIVSRMEAIAA